MPFLLYENQALRRDAKFACSQARRKHTLQSQRNEDTPCHLLKPLEAADVMKIRISIMDKNYALPCLHLILDTFLEILNILFGIFKFISLKIRLPR